MSANEDLLTTFQISRQAVLLDTNVLYAAFCSNDERHEAATLFLEIFTDPMVVPVPVLVEYWGLVVGRDKRPDLGLALLDWVQNPGNASLLPGDPELVGRCRSFCRRLSIDLVDAFLVSIADRLSVLHQIKPAIRIATFDNRDFYKCLGWQRHRLQMRLLNPETLEEYP